MLIDVKNESVDFEPLHRAVQAYVEDRRIPFASTVIVKNAQAIDVKHYVPDCGGDASVTLTDNTIFRANSVTKIVTSIAAMMLWEEGLIQLDDPLEKHLPEFSDMKVLGDKGAEPARTQITLRQLLSHTSGLSYGFVEPDSTIDKIYNGAGVNPMLLSPESTLDDLCKRLAKLPLAFHPGKSWRYSFATDVMARVIEVVSGERFDDFLQERIFDVLGMQDTGFYVPQEKQSRFVPAYTLVDPSTYSSPVGGVMDSPEEGMFSTPAQLLSGGGGLVTTMYDCYQLMRLIMLGGSLNGSRLLKQETLALMQQSHCPEQVYVHSPYWHMPFTKFGLGFAVKQKVEPDEPEESEGECHWGGIFGLHFWFSPKANLGGLCMTQVYPGFLHPFSRKFKQLAYELAGDSKITA